MSRIKILYCIDNLVRGGTELQVIGLIERLDRAKYEPYLLTIRPMDPALVPRGCVHLAWSVPKLFSAHGLRSVLKLASWLRKEKIDIVQTFFQDSTVFGGAAARLAGIPVRLASFRDLGFWSSRPQSLLMHVIYPFMTGFICNAEIVKEHFARQFALEKNRMTVLRNGVDVEVFAFGRSDQVKHVGIVGNMTREVKRTDLFIRAAASVAAKYPDIRWHIIGDGHLRPGLEELARELGVFEKIVFAGAVNDIPAYLAKLQIGVICSDSEGLSNALIEYMLAGVVPIATAVGGNPELVEHGERGLLVPRGDAPALANAIESLIRDTSLRCQLALNARRYVEEFYSWSRCLSEHDKFYSAQLSAGRG